MLKKSLFIILIFLLTSLVLAEEKELILGGDSGWNTFSTSNNISFTDSGRYGKQALQISTASESLTGSTDLLLHFEQDNAMYDATGNYSIISTDLSRTSQTIMGNYAGIAKGSLQGLELEGNTNSIFGKEGLTGSFTISFWLNPSLAENGETIFVWDSSRNVNNVPVFQLISVMFFQNRLEWNFTNIFSNYTDFKDIILKSANLVIPDTWSHHALSYNDNTGLIEYRVDGRLEDLTYATETGRASREVYSAILGTTAPITLCSNYTGRIDDFAIKKTFEESGIEKNMYAADGAYFETQPIGPFPYGSSVLNIEAISDIPTQTDIQYFVRAGDNFYEWTNNFPAWTAVSPNQNINNVQGRYFQVAANLFTDGNGEFTPTLTEIRLQYDEAEPPLPPFKVFAESGDGYVDLSWIPAAGMNPDGYIVYYGNAPGEYLGEGSIQGDSPIDVGQNDSFRISGLKNGKAYYFSISSYNYMPGKTEGVLSTEVYARPLKR